LGNAIGDMAARPRGFAALLSPSGDIVSLIYDALQLGAMAEPDSNLLDWVDTDSRAKAEIFLERARAEGSAFDWETNVPRAGQIMLLHLWGISLENGLLLLAGRSRDALYQLYDMITLSDDIEYASLHDRIRRKGLISAQSNASEEALYEELSRTNNELVNLQRELARANAKLRVDVEQLDAFVHSLSHDLRTPLMHMKGFADVLVEDYANRLDADGRQMLQWVSEGAARMDEMIHGILAYSRLSRSQLNLTHIDLASAVDEARLQALGSIAQIDFTVARPMPWVIGYRPILVQMVANLLSNATKFMAPGVRPQIRVWAQVTGRRQRRVRLWVEDNGIGISPEHQERIFDLFGRLHSEDEYRGTGVGLSIVRVGAERMGGRVGVESALGKGSRFWIELARAEESIE